MKKQLKKSEQEIIKSILKSVDLYGEILSFKYDVNYKKGCELALMEIINFCDDDFLEIFPKNFLHQIDVIAEQNPRLLRKILEPVFIETVEKFYSFKFWFLKNK